MLFRSAMPANQAGLADVAREQRKHGCAAALRFQKGGGRCGEAFEPDLAFVGDLGGQPIGAEQGMREPPRFAAELAERLREPTGECEVVKLAEDQAVFLPKLVER